MPNPAADHNSTGSAKDGSPEIVISADVHGAVVEVDAALWSQAVLLEALRQQLPKAGSPVSVWVDNPDQDTATLDEGDVFPLAEERLNEGMAGLGLSFQRDLYRMECPLPMSERTDIVTRAFVPGADDAAWLNVNNRAFRAHREQGGWTLEMLQERQAEDWFDPEGFRVYEAEHQGQERLAAFCWTKVHHDETPPAGEVYVIAVDPDFHGQGLGRALTLAGYQHLENVGLKRALLYVDADNTPAVTLYRNIGLEVVTVRRLFTD